MALLSAYEDFLTRTLGALSGTWKKLIFMAELRGENGKYEHWGLEYAYGPVAARKAITQAHAEIFQKVLETPLPALTQEFETERSRAGKEHDLHQMIPDERNGCLPEHFHYVHSALTLLAESRSSHQAA